MICSRQEGVEQVFAEFVASTPPEFAEAVNQARAAASHYEERGDLQVLDAAIAAWKQIIQHPDSGQATSAFLSVHYSNPLAQGFANDTRAAKS